ncbi:MAG: Asp-tRNA(Asn)/Glu-tRNA(Gln) amidotransferase subunit GatA [Chloroflexi bacterium]|nr:Asp-tRNA(Asn)/Glu-tRNA(Gln) amidotransferase subunit GatA [Chloroflexota bacterium]
MTDLTSLTIMQAGQKLAAAEMTSVELTRAYLDRIEAVEPQVQAFITITAEQALEQAQQADERRKKGEKGPLLGIPLAYKDVVTTLGVETTCGSRILEGYKPPYTATAVRFLEEAGAVMLGKLNMDEFAMGSSTENSGYKITRNPWDLERVPGGSSGGSAAAVAARMAAGTLGSDTGGSIRQPASLSGVVGLKPAYGRVSRYGLVAYSSSLDQIGPFAHTVEDVALLLEVIAGHDPRDSTSMQTADTGFASSLKQDLKGLRVGVPREFFIEGIEKDVESAVRRAIEKLAELGAAIIEISLPHTQYALPTYYLTATAECSANLARFDGIRYGPREQAGNVLETYRKTRGEMFGAEVKRRIMLGTYALSAGYYDAYYLKAQKIRTLIKRDFDEAFRQVDVIAAPASPTTAFKIGEKVDDPLQMYLNDIFTLSTNLAGICGLSVPCGFDQAGLPIGMQLLGPGFSADRPNAGEALILRAGHAYQHATDWREKTPAL